MSPESQLRADSAASALACRPSGSRARAHVAPAPAFDELARSAPAAASLSCVDSNARKTEGGAERERRRAPPREEEEARFPESDERLRRALILFQPNRRHRSSTP